MIRASEIGKLLSLEPSGDPDAEVICADQVVSDKKNYISFISEPSYLEHLGSTNASVLLLEEGLCSDTHIRQYLSSAKKGRACFVVRSAYAAFIRVLYKLDPGIHITGHVDETPGSMISEEADVASDAVIYPGVFIGRGVGIGSNTIIFPGTVIMGDSRIGSNSLIYPNVTIYPKSFIGNKVIIGSGSVIGSDGFGFVEYGGELLKVPHLGSTVIEDDVEIGSNTSIDRGTLGSTVIGRGTKIDNLVQVAHNCRTGSGCILCGMVGLSGTTTLGDKVIMAANSGTKGHLTINSNCVVTARTSVTKDLPAGSEVKGYPARPLAEELKIQTLIGKLPELYRRIKKLEKEIDNGKRNG
ncbi:MAG: UDP-3-O-(3-hydroxymyristoyl)glucosamine N-acyltransferase [Oligoflexia bacterium]|nr:UDP-3-O-(3-hydroxymyristoyl)glucosamine N-acyltransferase [Oligoflexia bacterium]